MQKKLPYSLAMLYFCSTGVTHYGFGFAYRRILIAMKLLLILCAATALLTAFWAANMFVWLFVGLGLICALSLGALQRHSELSCLVASAFFIAGGFTSLHANITGMAADAVDPQVTTFASPVVLVLMSSLLFCIAMVERHAMLSAAAHLASKSPLKRHWL